MSEGSDAETQLADDGRLHCMEKLSRWNEMEMTLLSNLDGDWSRLWSANNMVSAPLLCHYLSFPFIYNGSPHHHNEDELLTEFLLPLSL